MIWVSPAFFFSLYSTDFTIDDYIRGLYKLKDLGLEGFQLEVFHPTRLSEWEQQSPRLAAKADALSLIPTQFVAHFLLESTRDP